MQSGKGNSSRRGATLVEVLVALGIAVLIIAVIVTVHHTLTRHASNQAELLKTNDRVAGTTRELREDLQNLFLPEDNPDCGIELQNDTNRLVSFSFCRWQMAAGRYPVYTNRLERVSYIIGERKGRPALLKSVQHLTGPQALQPAVTNWVEPGWPDIRIQLHDGNSWQSSWSTEEPNSSKTPGAALIQFMAMPDGADSFVPVRETMVIIPAGMRVTSSISRESNTAE